MPLEVPVLGPRTRSRGPRSAFWNGPDCTPAELQGAGPCSVGVSLQPFDLLAVAALPRSRSVPIESGSASSTSPRETGRGAWDWCCRRWRGRFRNRCVTPVGVVICIHQARAWETCVLEPPAVPMPAWVPLQAPGETIAGRVLGSRGPWAPSPPLHSAGCRSHFLNTHPGSRCQYLESSFTQLRVSGPPPPRG